MDQSAVDFISDFTVFTPLPVVFALEIFLGGKMGAGRNYDDLPGVQFDRRKAGGENGRKKKIFMGNLFWNSIFWNPSSDFRNMSARRL